MDFGTWRLVGWGLLGLGSLAVVVAIVAIIAMFRSADVDVDRRNADADWDDEDYDDHDDHDEEDDDQDEDEGDDSFGRDDRRVHVAAVATGHERDSGPGSPTIRPWNPQEPHVASPDWYAYPDAVDDAAGSSDVGQDAVATFGTDEPSDSKPVARPPSFPWEVAATAASAVPERPNEPERQEPQRPQPAWLDERAESPAVEAAPIAPAVAQERPSRHGSSSPEPMTEPAAPEQATSTGRRRRVDAYEDTSNSGAVEVAPVQPDPPVRQDPDAPSADWYDDPDGSGGERWWDGSGWTRRRRPKFQPNHPPAEAPNSAE